ncbi:MAG: glyoxylate/hydroxypyruvate reductase A [Burkholderiales bacterium]|nr:glyoxylate/hydroxypyruvate reductase A [Burkholderiales bacterium]
MRIAFCCTDTASEPWLLGLRAALPGADLSLWAPGAPPADYAVVWAPPQQFFDEQAQLKAVFNIGAGVDALLKLKLPPQAQIVRLDDAGMSVQMAEYVCHAVIRHFREFDAYEADTGQGKWSFRKPRARGDFPVGIMGLGVLGTRVARSLAQFEFAVNGWSRSPKVLGDWVTERSAPCPPPALRAPPLPTQNALPPSHLEGVKCFSGADGFKDFLAASRVLVCLLPLTPDTRDIMNRDSLSRLQAGGYVINVARGAHLVEDDLLTLLDSGHLAGATLDVFRTEPLPVGHPFWTHPKITVTPHTSARTLRSESIAQIAGKIAALQRGEPVAGVVEPSRGY